MSPACATPHTLLCKGSDHSRNHRQDDAREVSLSENPNGISHRSKYCDREPPQADTVRLAAKPEDTGGTVQSELSPSILDSTDGLPCATFLDDGPLIPTTQNKIKRRNKKGGD